MIVVGVVLLLLVLAVAITLITSGNDPTSFSLLGISIDTSARNVYLLGAFSLLLAVVALFLIRRGVHRSREISKENKTLRKEVKASRKSVAAAHAAGPANDDPADRPDAAAPNDEPRTGHDAVSDHFDSTPRETPPRQ